jgi:hypothetical protein
MQGIVYRIEFETKSEIWCNREATRRDGAGAPSGHGKIISPKFSVYNNNNNNIFLQT